MSSRFTLIASVISCAAGISAAATPVGERAWQAVEPSDGSVPTARHEAGYVAVGKYGLLIGGRGLKPTDRFDFEARTWTPGAEPRIELHHIQPIVRNGKAIVVGAMTGPYPNEFAVPYAMVYDPNADRWQRGFDIPYQRLRGSTGNVLVGDKLYIACGLRDGHRGDHKAWLDSYNFETGEWTQLADAPRPRDHFAAAHVDGKIYLIGGRRSQAPKNTFTEVEPATDVYDVATDTWSTIDPIPTPRAGLFVVTFGTDIVAIGGESGDQKVAHDEVEVLDTLTGTWSTWPKLKRGRHGGGAAVYNNTIFVASGSGNRGGGPELQTQESLELIE